ncbi:MAG: tetratricopeptide repeat protein [Candidatus Omnitrophota bacterium]|nr:tetratricopeptide repeat protein [Candidatus Omnitrophota bacterium]
MRNYKPQTQGDYQRLGPPLFAKIAIFVIIGLFLSVLFGRLYKEQQYGTIQHIVINKTKRVFKPTEFRYEQNDAQSLHLRAKFLIKQGRYKEAEIEAQKSLQAKGNFYRAYMDLGVVYSSYGDYLRAEKVFKSALEFIGNDTFDLEIIYGDLGLIYLVERRFNEAWEYFRKAYERKTYLGDDFWADSRLRYVIENNKIKFIEQGENHKRFPLEISQRQKWLKALLEKNNDEIIRDCEQYLLDNPGSVYSYVFRSLLVSALFRKGEYEKAFEQLKIVESENLPSNYIPWVKLMYAYLYDEKGEKQKAVTYLKDIIAHYPDYESIDQAKAMLERIKEGRPGGGY